MCFAHIFNVFNTDGGFGPLIFISANGLHAVIPILSMVSEELWLIYEYGQCLTLDFELILRISLILLIYK